MRFIHLGETEETNNTWSEKKKILICYSNSKTNGSITQDDQSQSIEPGTNVGESPQDECEFDRVDQIFNEEQPTEL